MAGYVTVGCKMPNGLELRLMESYEWNEPVMGGGTRSVTLYRQKGESVILKGNSAPEGIALITHGGYALTSNVDADFWEAWVSQNKDSDLLKKHIVYALPKEESAAAKGRELDEIKSGLERLDPNHLPKVGIGGAQIMTSDIR